jgi:hypothetical protein
VLISENIIATNTFAGVKIGQVNNVDSTLINNIILEKNHYQTTPTGGAPIVVHANDVTIRNEIMDISNSSAFHTGASVEGATAGMAASTAINIYNNTIYSGSAGDFFGITLATGVSGVSVRNNIGFAPSSTTSRIMISDNASGTLQSNNTLNGQITLSPAFSNGSGAFNTPTDFTLTVGSYARDAGTAVPVLSDFFRVTRPVNGAWDLGATEQ